MSYSIAEEGSNNLYLKLIQTMLTKRSEYNMVEIEMILNYFPHTIWTSEGLEIKSLREQFYQPILAMVRANLSEMDNR